MTAKLLTKERLKEIRNLDGNAFIGTHQQWAQRDYLARRDLLGHVEALEARLAKATEALKKARGFFTTNDIAPPCLEAIHAALGAESPAVAPEPDVQSMVQRFLTWKLPETFAPDGGVDFARQDRDPSSPHWPVGTNLLTATEAEEMIRHILGAPPAVSEAKADDEWVENADYWEPAPTESMATLRAEVERLKAELAEARKQLSIQDFCFNAVAGQRDAAESRLASLEKVSAEMAKALKAVMQHVEPRTITRAARLTEADAALAAYSQYLETKGGGT